MNDETQNDNKGNKNSPDQQLNVTGIQHVDQSNPSIDNQNKKIPLFSRKSFGKKLAITGLILAIVVSVVWFNLGFFLYGLCGDDCTYPEIRAHESIVSLGYIIIFLSLIVVAIGFIVNFKSYKYTMKHSKLRYLYLITSFLLLIFSSFNIIMFSLSIIDNLTYSTPKPKNESALLKEFQSESNNDIVSISNFKAEESHDKDGYDYSGTYYIKGLNAGIDFSYGQINNFIFDGSVIDIRPYEKNPYFKNFALYKTYFKNDSEWKSFEDFYNQTGETKLGMIDRTIDLAYNVNDQINLKTVRVDGHPFNVVLAVSSNMDCRNDNATCKVYIIYFDKSSSSWKLITDNYKNRFNLLSN